LVERVRVAKYATLVNDLIECKLDDARPLARFTARLHWNVLKLERHAVDLTFAASNRAPRDRRRARADAAQSPAPPPPARDVVQRVARRARRSLAPALLATADSNVEQVGFRLGYSEPTAFIRAFKKWYGMTPGSFRRTKSIG
jgi:AraC-like DNA-binding protein